MTPARGQWNRMKALRLHRFGGPAVLQYEELPSPRPGPGQYLIAVGAAGVNPVDTKIRAGTFALYRARPPEILGRDVAGVVRAFGGGGRPAFAIGQAVFGMLDYGRGG